MNLRWFGTYPLWRRYEQLDVLLDEEAYYFFVAVLQRHRWRRRLLKVGYWVTAIVVCVGVFIAAMYLLARAVPNSAVLGNNSWMVLAAYFGMTFVPLGIAWLLDAYLDHVVIGRVLQRQLESNTCFECRYDLAGLEAVVMRGGAPHVTCPECGTSNVVLTHITRADSYTTPS